MSGPERRVGSVVVPVLLLGLALAMPARAQEPSGMQAAVALEEVLVKTIAQAERSVVAIARVRHNEDDRLDLAGDPLGRLRNERPARPTDAEFVPNEYATGVIIGADGLVLTAHHVLRDNSDYWITTSDRKVHQATVIAADPRSDLAVFSIRASGLTPIKFGDAAKLRKGQIVIALGNPYAIARDGQASASWGIVSNLSRRDGPWAPRASEADGVTRPTLHHYGSLIQTDAKLNLGTSGGALLNLQGEMVGLTVSLAASLGYEQAAGFALPVDETFRRVVDRLKEGREAEFGLLGVQPRALELPERERGLHGVRVTVMDGTPASRSQLRSDDVITHIDGTEIHSIDDMMLQIGKLPPEASVQLSVLRGNVPVLITVPELTKYWVTGRKVVTTPSPAWRGVRVDYVTATPEFRPASLPMRIDPQGSVLITEVEENSPAWNEGLRPRMMISHVGGNRVATPKQFFDAVAGQNGPVKLRLSLPPRERPERVIPPPAAG